MALLVVKGRSGREADVHDLRAGARAEEPERGRQRLRPPVHPSQPPLRAELPVRQEPNAQCKWATFTKFVRRATAISAATTTISDFGVRDAQLGPAHRGSFAALAGIPPLKNLSSWLRQVAAGGDCEDHLKLVLEGEIVDMEISGGCGGPCPSIASTAPAALRDRGAARRICAISIPIRCSRPWCPIPARRCSTSGRAARLRPPTSRAGLSRTWRSSSIRSITSGAACTTPSARKALPDHAGGGRRGHSCDRHGQERQRFPVQAC